MEELATQIKVGIEEVILLVLLGISLLAMVALLPGDIHFIKKIISWIGLGYLLYKIDLAELFYGHKRKWIDGLLIFSYFCLILKDFFTFSKELTKETFVLFDFNLLFEKSMTLGGKLYLFQNPLAETIEFYAFILGAGLLIGLALFQIFSNVEIRRPSVLGILHEGTPSSLLDRLYRAITSLFVFTAFFVIIFNLIMEWLAWIVHSWITIFAIFFYFFFFLKYHRQFHVSTMLFKIGSTGHEFYHRFLALFTGRETVLLGIAGMLVLHLLTDVSAFVIPYIIGKNVSYFASLGPQHDPLLVPLLADIAKSSTPLGASGIVLAYLLNVLAILFLFLGPAYLWRAIYRDTPVTSSSVLLALFYPAVLVFFLAPTFLIKKLESVAETSLVGVDILTQGVAPDTLSMILLLALGIAFLVVILSLFQKTRLFLMALVVLCVQLFFGWYVYLYFASVAQSYLALLFSPGLPFLFAMFFWLFFLITILFYIGGFLSFIVMPWRRSLIRLQQIE